MARIFRLAYILAGFLGALFLTSMASVTMTRSLSANVSGSGISLIGWDETDAYGGGHGKYTYPASYYAHPTKCLGKSFEEYDTIFFANYSNSTGQPITDAGGDCEIRFDQDNDSTYESWAGMAYNATTKLWAYNRSFTYKGILSWQASCTSQAYDNLSLTDNVTILNTAPCTFGIDPGNYLPSMSCAEDTPCTYDFGENVTDDDANDALAYSCDGICFSGFSINSGTGVWTTLVGTDALCGQKTQNITAKDSNGVSGAVAKQNITIGAVNDPPAFVTMPTGATEDSSYAFTLSATDEEGNLPLNMSINITGCNKAFWITGPGRNNCSLFQTNQTGPSSIAILNFTPTNWQVGSYTVNYTATDSGSPNATYSVVASFDVANVNDRPNLTPWNSTAIVTSQNSLLFLLFNGTDIENDTLSFAASAFYPNMTQFPNSSLFQMYTNSTFYPNESAYGIFSLIMNNGHVGNYTINVTLADDGTSPVNLTATFAFNLTVLNVNDPPELTGLEAELTSVQGEPYLFNVSADDPDFLTIYGEALGFGINMTSCETLTGGADCNGFEAGTTINITQTGPKGAILFVLAERNDTGNYTMNLTVTDSGGLCNWTLVNLTIVPDWPPSINAPAVLWANQTEDFWAEFNVTDSENNTVNITYRNLLSNMTQTSSLLFPLNITNYSFPPYYNITMNYSPVNNSQVGNFTIEITARDSWNRTSVAYVNMTVSNVNDPPSITDFVSCWNEGESHGLELDVFENAPTCLILAVPDPDLLTQYSDSLAYILDLTGCSASGEIPPGGNCSGSFSWLEASERGYFNFTAPDESWQGNYTFNLTVTDSGNLSDSVIINMSLSAVNDPPVLLTLTLSNGSGYNITYQFPILNRIDVFEGTTYNLTINASDEEGNLPLSYNVSFPSCELMMGGSGCGLFDMGSTSGEAGFKANASFVGNFSINFTVTDSGNTTLPHNATGYSLMNLSVLMIQHAPDISFLTCGDCDVSEGGTQTISYGASDLDNQSVTCGWYFDGDLRDTEQNCNASFRTWDFAAGYDDAYNYTSVVRPLTLVVTDDTLRSSNKSVNLTLHNVNRAPRFTNNITSPIIWKSKTSISAIDLGNNFADDYGETLAYTYEGAQNIDVAIGGDGTVTLTPSGSWTGVEFIVFTANDSILTNSSNNVTLIVQYQPPETVPTPTSYINRPKEISMRISVPQLINLEELNTTMAKIVILNDGGFDLFDIRLSAWSNDTANLSVVIKDTNISALKIGANFTTWVNITTRSIELNSSYLVTVLAEALSPPHNDSGTITVTATPKPVLSTLVEIVMVKDMFEENPECMELFGMIIRAEESLASGNVAEARRLTKLAMDNCQDMIDYARVRGNQTAPTGMAAGQLVTDPFFIMGLSAAILALAMLGFYVVSRSRAPPPKE